MTPDLRTWACPACGASRALTVWREAVSLELPTLTCDMVTGWWKWPAEGCDLLVCTWAGGRLVWAAEAEGLAELLAEDRMTRARAELTAAEADCNAADALADDDPAREEAEGRMVRALAEFNAALNESVRASQRRGEALLEDAIALRGR